MGAAERIRAAQRIVVHDVSWETYQSLLADRGERPVPRMCYDQGELELMSPSQEHEQYRRLLGRMIDRRSDGCYQAVEESVNLPGFPVKDAVDLIARAEATDEASWARAFQCWVRQRGEGATQ